MRSIDERMALVAVQTRALDRKRERRALLGLSSASACLLVVLAAVIGRLSGSSHDLLSESMAASSLLSESAGGYVLVAVLSFTAAVLITVLCFRYRRMRENQNSEDASHPSKEETP